MSPEDVSPKAAVNPPAGLEVAGMIAFIIRRWLDDMDITDEEFIRVSGYDKRTFDYWMSSHYVPQLMPLKDIVETFGKFGNWHAYKKHIAYKLLIDLRTDELLMRKRQKGLK